MRSLSRLFLFVLSSAVLSTLIVFLTSSEVFARAPEKRSERSLLYWRYLCRGEKQEESVKGDVRELKCTSQNWVVRTPASSGVVMEIIDENP